MGETIAASAKATASGIAGIIQLMKYPTPTTVNTTRPSASSRIVPLSRNNPSFGMRQPSRKSSGGRNRRKKISGFSSTPRFGDRSNECAARHLNERQRQSHRRHARERDADHDGQQKKQGNSNRLHNLLAMIDADRSLAARSVAHIRRAGELRAWSALRRVVLVTGTKYYGSYLGPFKTPARESDPRHMGPKYYFEQIDSLAAFQRGKRWDCVDLLDREDAAPAGISKAAAVEIITVMSAFLKSHLDRPSRLVARRDERDV